MEHGRIWLLGLYFELFPQSYFYQALNRLALQVNMSISDFRLVYSGAQKLANHFTRPDCTLNSKFEVTFQTLSTTIA